MAGVVRGQVRRIGLLRPGGGAKETAAGEVKGEAVSRAEHARVAAERDELRRTVEEALEAAGGGADLVASVKARMEERAQAQARADELQRLVDGEDVSEEEAEMAREHGEMRSRLERIGRRVGGSGVGGSAAQVEDALEATLRRGAEAEAREAKLHDTVAREREEKGRLREERDTALGRAARLQGRVEAAVEELHREGRPGGGWRRGCWSCSPAAGTTQEGRKGRTARGSARR